jgi:hypothetical protein
MRERWALETGDLLFEPPLTASPAPDQRRVVIRAPTGQLFSGIMIRYHGDAPFTLHIPPALMIEQSPDPTSTTLPLTILDREVLRQRITMALSTKTPVARPQPITQPPLMSAPGNHAPQEPINHRL